VILLMQTAIADNHAPLAEDTVSSGLRQAITRERAHPALCAESCCTAPPKPGKVEGLRRCRTRIDARLDMAQSSGVPRCYFPPVPACLMARAIVLANT
jgi:hypothetical protein